MSGMSEAPKRRWFRFSLRSLFLVVTALCLWLGWNVNVVRLRRAVLAQVPNDIGVVEWKIATRATDRDHLDARIASIKDSTHCRRHAAPSAGPRLSLIRRWLGDEPIGVVALWNESDFHRISSLFPEALTVLFDRTEPSGAVDVSPPVFPPPPQ